MCFLPVFMKPWIYVQEVQFIKCHGWVIWPVVWARNSYPMILKAERLIHNRCCLGGSHYRQCFSINEMLLWAIDPISFNQWTFITTFTKKEAVCSSYKTACSLLPRSPSSFLKLMLLTCPLAEFRGYCSAFKQIISRFILKCVVQSQERREPSSWQGHDGQHGT